MTEELVGQVAELYRFPVKSLSGERLDEVQVDARGCRGDRLWSVRDPDGKFGSGKSTRRFRRMDGLLDLAAAYDGDVPVLRLPDGRRVRGDDEAVHEVLTALVGRPVTLTRERDASHFDEGPVHLVTTASLRTLGGAHGRPVDPRRTRANIVVECSARGFPEHGWLGRCVQVGEVVLRVSAPMPRCVMVTAAQDGLPRDPGLLGSVTEVSAGMLGVVAEVVRPGLVRRDAGVRLVREPSDPTPGRAAG